MSAATILIVDDEALVGWSLRERANGNLTQAAQVLGVNRDQVRSRIARIRTPCGPEPDPQTAA